MLKKYFLVLLVIPSITMAQEELNSTTVSTDEAVAPYTGILQPDCEIDKAMDQNYKAAEQATHAATEVIRNHVQAKDAACLPVLEDIGKLISMSMPSMESFTFAGLLDRIKKAACEAANTALKRTADSFNVSYKSPYGLASFKIGASTTGDQETYKTSSVDPYSVLEKQAIGIGSDLGKKAAGEVSDSLPKVDGVNRKLRNQTSEQNSDVSDWRKSVDDAIKKL